MQALAPATKGDSMDSDLNQAATAFGDLRKEGKSRQPCWCRKLTDRLTDFRNMAELAVIAPYFCF